MKVDLKNLCKTPILAGALSGRMALNQLLEKTAVEPDSPVLIFLDFSKIDVATVSFLRESIFAFRDIIRGRHSAFYPVVANANESVHDELMEFLRVRNDALMSCILTESDTVLKVNLLGKLDPKQSLTFDLVNKHGEADAGALMREYGESEGMRHTTAWNNRLASLAGRGLVVEQTQGRIKRYRPLFDGA